MPDDSENARRRMVNLTFHGIGTPAREIPLEEKSVWVSVSNFTNILNALAGRADVMLTFDDGNASDVELGLPALVSRGMRAAFFVLAGRLGQPGSLAARDLRTLRTAGMIVGLHGMNHSPWRKMNEAELTVELVDARKKIEDAVGESVNWAACPFGSYGRRVLARLRTEGFERVFTSDRGPANACAWLQPRNTIHSDDSPYTVEQICGRSQALLTRQVRLLIKRSL